MADRTIVVRLRAEANQYKSEMDAAAKSAEKTGAAAEAAGKKVQQSGSQFQRMVNHARQNEEAWTTAGTALSAFGGGIVALGLAAGKSGVEFNSLKQTSGAALKTVMGSADAAKKQMDKLNEFGKDSWVMRDVLIRAQQQMTGFGIETKKVIPYLDGLQEAVAASGGNSRQFEELAGVMAKVKSEGKITATTFQEFGTRGIDAATIIGEAMGKTGEEIRASVTEGSLDADKALDALAEGMKTKFDGATGNLRNTFRGAMDNLMAAWRDLSASMAEPLVGPDGGGLGVSALNALADAIADVQTRADALPNGVKATILALGGIAGAGSLAAGGFLVLLPKILETKKAFDTLSAGGGILGATTRGLGKVGKAASVAAAAFVALGAASVVANKLSDNVKTSSELENSLKQLANQGGITKDSLNELVEMSGSGGASVSDFGYALESLDMGGFMKTLDWIGSGFGAFDSDLKLAEETVANLDQTMIGFASEGNWGKLTDTFTAAAQSAADYGYEAEDLLDRMPALKGVLIEQADALGVSTDNATLLKIAYGDIKPAAAEAGAGFEGLSEKALAAQEHLEEVRKSLVESANGFIDFAGKATESKTSLEEWISYLEEQVEAQANWLTNLETLAERGAPQALLDQLMAMGPEGAAMVKKLADGSDEDMQRVIDVFSESQTNVQEFANTVAGIPPIDLDADASKLEGQVQTAKDRLAELKKLPTSPEISAQITLLEEKIKEAEGKLKELEGKPPAKPKVDADTKPAKSSVEAFDDWLEEHNSPIMNIDAKIRIINEGQIRNMPETLLNPNRKQVRAPGVEKKATGGPIVGPGTGTSDDILAMLSNGEHVWTDEEVRKAGGHGVVEAWRQQVRAGMVPAFAGGGAVGSARRRLSSAEKRLDAISRAGRKTTPAERRREQAQAKVDAARESLRKAEERQREAERKAEERRREAERKAKEERERRARVNDLRTDLRTDLRRGDLRDQITGGLSGGYSAVDRLFGLGANEDLSRSSRSRANSSARKFETSLRSLYKQAERIDEKLKAAQDKAAELNRIKDSVSSGLLNERTVDVGDYQNFANGQWATHSGLAGATRRLSADVGAMKSFAGKLKKLAAAGIPGAIIQEIASAGVAEGSTMADAFLDATDAERQSYIGAWSDYEKYANQAGQYVSEGFHKGGAAAADGVVKGLEGKQKNVEAAIANLAKAMESTFKQVLGIASPSKVTTALGEFVGDGAVVGIRNRIVDVQAAAAELAAAAVPSAPLSTTMAVDVTAAPVTGDDLGAAGLAMNDMSATTLSAMEQMKATVAEGFAGMLTDTQAAQLAMLLGTQTTQQQMLADTQLNQTGMLTATQAANLGQLTDTQTQQAAMLLNTQTQNTAMLTDTQTKQESMRATVATKQAAQKTVMTDEQEAMRLMLIDKQNQMKIKSESDFESMKATTGSKFSAMRRETDTTMANLHTDYSSRLSTLQTTNETGFEAMKATSDKNMAGIRSGIDGEMKAAKPELGNNLNSLISVLGSFTKSVNKAFGDVGVELSAPAALRFAEGGVMPGYTPGRDVHHFRSRSAGDLYLSGGEGILRPETTRLVGGEKGIAALNKAGKAGDLDSVTHILGGMAFAHGGVVPRIPGVNAFADAGVWRNLWAITRNQFPNARLTSAYRGGSRTVSGNASYHSRGMAIDVSPSMDIFNFWRNKYGANLAELIYSPANGKQIKNGANHYYTGAVRGMHFNHVHIAARQALSDAMAGGLPGMGGPMSHPFLDRAGVSAGGDLQKAYARAAEKLTQEIYSKHVGQLPDGIGGQIGKGIMSQVSEGLVAKAKEYGKTTAVSGTTAGDPAVKAAVRRVAEQMGWGQYWGDIDWLVNKESSWNPKAANPTSSARGLFQKMTSLHGPVEDTVEGQARWGLNYIKRTYGNPAAARAHHQRSNWYEGGTERAKRGLAVVGEKGPELVNFRGGEQIMSTVDSMKHMATNRSFIPTSLGAGGIDYDRLASAVVDNLPPSLVQTIDSSSLDAQRIGKQAVQEWTDKQNLYAMGARL